MKIQIKILNKEFYKTGNLLLTNPPKEEFKLPSYATPGSAALDLVCTEDLTIYPGQTASIKTGLAVWIGSSRRTLEEVCISSAQYPQGTYTDIGYAGLIVPRSGLGTKGLILANTIGVIDQDYQGELVIQAWNRNKRNQMPLGVSNAVQIKAGDRVAQLMFVPVIKAQWDIVDEFSAVTERGEGGFGSSGV